MSFCNLKKKKHQSIQNVLLNILKGNYLNKNGAFIFLYMEQRSSGFLSLSFDFTIWNISLCLKKFMWKYFFVEILAFWLEIFCKTSAVFMLSEVISPFSHMAELEDQRHNSEHQMNTPWTM